MANIFMYKNDKRINLEQKGERKRESYNERDKKRYKREKKFGQVNDFSVLLHQFLSKAKALESNR